MELRSETEIRLEDESPRKEFPIEWWFIQGHFENEEIGPSRFMVSLFRHALEWGGLSAGDSSSLLISVLENSSRSAASLSQLDAATIPFLVAALRLAPPKGLCPVAVRAFAEEIEQNGLLKSIETPPFGATIDSCPLRATWGDFELSQTEEAFVLAFTQPKSERRCSFRLKPVHPRFHLSDVAVANGGSMDYVCYTRLALEGEVDGKAVQGEAWVDHQWGNQGWFVAGEETKQILGWDWLGIQLENGFDLLIMIIRDQRSFTALCQYAVVINGGAETRLLREFEIIPTAWWTSPVSGASYPVECRVTIPSLEMELDFEPLALEQEIPVFPPIGAIWEGAGRVKGTWGERAVSGRARLELHGYAYPLDQE